MLARLKVTGVEKSQQPEGDKFILVTFDFLEGENFLESHSQQFPLSVTKDEIQAHLQTVLNEFNAQRNQVDPVEEQADKTIVEVNGLEVSPVQEEESINQETENPVTSEQPQDPNVSENTENDTTNETAVNNDTGAATQPQNTETQTNQ